MEVPLLCNEKNSIGEFFSVAITNNFQQADTGTKMVHLGEIQSTIIAKGICAGKSNGSYRGLVKIAKGAKIQEIFHSTFHC